MTGAGGRVEYRSLDLRDATAVAEAVAAVREAHGRIDVLVHAGGIEISRDLPQKEPAEFERVFDIKADGFFNLLKAAEGMPIGATVVFSSVAGRFGNAGQTDYSAANALLCSLSSHLRSLRPQTRPIAIDWTAWGGIGMATRGSIPKIMEAAGIEMLPPEVGIPTVRRELVAGSGYGEVVVAGRLGILGIEWDETGGLDLEKASAALASRKPPFVMTGRLTRARLYGGLEVETTLDPKVQPFLVDHAIEGTPLLPGVMACETFAEAAGLLAPGLRVVALEDVVFDKPLKYYRNEPVPFFVEQSARPGKDESLVVSSRLTTRIQPKPELAAVEKLHFTGTVRLESRTPRKTSVPFNKPALKSLGIGREAIYQVYFHGPAYQVLERARVEGREAIGLMARDLPANSAPPDAASLVEPRLIELLFQTAGIWQIATEKRLALPSTLRSLRVLRPADKAEGRLFALVRREDDASFSASVVDETGAVFIEIGGYTTVTLEEGRSLPSGA